MSTGWKPGPVFLLETRHVARVGKAHIGRVLVIGVAVLVGATILFLTRTVARQNGPEWIFGVCAVLQIAWALLLGPALTAGSICQDKRRGLIDHFLVTDLSSAEIILGKLAARLWLCLEFLAALPVVLLCGILCDVDPEAIARSTLISLGILVLGATLALAFSVWGTKTHEALMTAYVTFGAWMLSTPIGWAIAFYLDKPEPPTWFRKTNPFWLALAPYADPGVSPFTEVFLFFGITSLISLALCVAMIASLRRVAGTAGAPKARGHGKAGANPKRLRFFMGPSLDPNPVLWREWRRLRSTRWGERLWLAYAVGAILCGAVAVDQEVSMRVWMGSGLATTVNVTQATVGLLLFCVAAASAWSEERGLGALDSLLATPLSTRAIVWGKWWGIYRVVPAIALICAFVTIGPAWRNDRLLPPVMTFFSVCGQGAVWTSLGLLAATWFTRDSKAIVATVAAFLIIDVGGYVLLRAFGRVSSGRSSYSLWFMYWGDALYAVGELTIGPEWAYGRLEKNWNMWLKWIAIWDVIDALISVGLVSLAIATFPRAFGRMVDRGGRDRNRITPQRIST